MNANTRDFEAELQAQRLKQKKQVRSITVKEEAVAATAL